MSECMEVLGSVYFVGLIVMFFLALINESIHYILLAPVWPIVYSKYVYIKLWGGR